MADKDVEEFGELMGNLEGKYLDGSKEKNLIY